jgi:hypothetical protein
MPTTPTYGFRYPSVTDPPNVPLDIQNLAVDVEAKIAAMDAILGAVITNRFMGSSAPATLQVIGTSETIMDERVTFTAVSGHKYLIMHSADFAIASGGASTSTFRYRYASGASVTTAGTLIQEYLGAPPTAAHTTYTRHTAFTAPSSGQFTIGCGYVTNTGTVNFYANSKRLTIVDVT